MTRTPRRKKTDTAEALAEREARKAQIIALKAQGVRVVHDNEYRIIAAHRLDVFSLLHSRKGPQEDGKPGKAALTDQQLRAARRLENLIAIAYGHERPEISMDRVDKATATASEQITQAMIDASRLLQIVLSKCGRRDAELLCALMSGTNARLGSGWRDTVERITDESRKEAQAAVIRAACQNLVLAWQALDYAARERKARAA
jgi:ribosomal protein L25 (general stress protein Ctc)